uniref:hypothetical protein n=1 Tax=uncultured Christiangramia sp. TaxID=503836 RepID=UPI00262E9D06|nr:hypothetical protein [uncultured Christiangramia sp.]
MQKKDIKYPVALNLINNEIIPTKNVTEQNRPNLICPVCKDKFTAVLNHQTPHFKHKPHINCSGSVETYVHWLAKELFKKIKEFEIPELMIDDLPEKHRQKFQRNFDSNVPETFRGEFKKGLKNNLTNSKVLAFEKLETEKEYKTQIGDVRVDIVATVQDEEFFIEPFFSNIIDDKKKEKLFFIEKPTLSLNLSNFVGNFYFNFSEDFLKNYLISKKSKKWVYLTDKEYTKCIENYKEYLNEEIKRQESLINLHRSKLEKISKLEKECEIRSDKISDLHKEISDLRDEIYSLKNELGIYF